MYSFIRSILFLFDAEAVHYFSMNIFRFLCGFSFIRKIIQKQLAPLSSTPVSLFDLHFKNPVGLGAGFDKNAGYLRELETMGFGFVEIGTVTPLPQAGNDKPRLFRLPKDKALINRMGFNNAGIKEVVKNLKKRNSKIIVGGNIGKNKLTENDDALSDYMIAFKGLADYVDYFVVNVSSPNTPGLRDLQEKEPLKKILAALQRENQKHKKPVLLKIAPDLTDFQLDDIVEIVTETGIAGVIATNTTLSRADLQTDDKEVEKIGAGGLSGKPLKDRSTEVIKYLSQKSDGKFGIIGAGGIYNAQDAKEKLEAGASLVQVYSGFIYEGPAIAKNINKELI
jgi:dihydroorotate dehydrogenase